MSTNDVIVIGILFTFFTLSAFSSAWRDRGVAKYKALEAANRSAAETPAVDLGADSKPLTGEN